MKILVNRRPVSGPWGGGNLFVKALCDRLLKDGHEVVHNLCDGVEKIVVVDPRPEGGFDTIESIISYSMSRSAPITIRVNECDARKGTTGLDSFLSSVSAYCHKTIFVSKWMMNYHLERGWKCKSVDFVYNGVDRSIFKERERLSNGKINLVTHHWSNNPMKGFDIYEKLDSYIRNDDRFTFTYIGRDRGSFKNSRVVQPLFGKDLGEELSKYDVYISASLFDPGPNHVIESIASRIPTFAIKDGGGACEFVGDDWIYDNFDDLLGKIQNARMNQDLFGDWDTCMDDFLVKAA